MGLLSPEPTISENTLLITDDNIPVDQLEDIEEKPKIFIKKVEGGSQ